MSNNKENDFSLDNEELAAEPAAADSEASDGLHEEDSNAEAVEAAAEAAEEAAEDIKQGSVYSKENTSGSVNDSAKSKAQSYRNKHKGIKIALVSVFSVVVLCAAAYCIFVNAYSSIMPNMTVGNVNIGGMSQEEAANALRAEFDSSKLAGQTINMYCVSNGSVVNSSSINAENLSINFEPEKTASDAYLAGRENNSFFSKLARFTSSLFSRGSIDIVMTYDEQALTGAISDLCSQYEREPLGYTYRLGDNSDIIIAKPQDGLKVDMNAAVDSVMEEILTFRFSDVAFEPIVTKAPELDIDDFYNYITSPAKDATYAKDENNKVYVVPGKPQIVVSKSAIENAVAQPDEEYSVPVQVVDSAVNAEFLQSILYEDTLGTYTTDYSGSSASRSNNILLSSNTISGLELLPGERFDFNQVVGQRTPQRGYQQAPVYVVKDGETVSESDYGGGICQVSSTIYCAVYRAGLNVISRTSHSKGVSYVPVGMDATVSWGGPEFIFENSTDYPIRILVQAGGGVLTARIVGAKAQTPNVSIDVQNDGDSVVVTKTTTNTDGSTVQEVFDSHALPTPSSSSPTSDSQSTSPSV